MPNPKVKSQKVQTFKILVFKRGHGERENKKEKENKCEGKEKTGSEKRDNRWTNGWTTGGHKEVTHACKMDNLKNDTKRKVKCCSKANDSEGNENWVQEEEDQENKKIKRNEGWKKDERKTQIIEKDSIFCSCGRVLKRKITKETKLSKNITRKRIEKKKRSSKKEQNYVFVRM